LNAVTMRAFTFAEVRAYSARGLQGQGRIKSAVTPRGKIRLAKCAAHHRQQEQVATDHRETRFQTAEKAVVPKAPAISGLPGRIAIL
jgi:hypothetical protein